MKLKIQSIKDYFKSKKDKGLKPVFFKKIGDQNTSRDEMLKNLIKVLGLRVLKLKIKNKLFHCALCVPVVKKVVN